MTTNRMTEAERKSILSEIRHVLQRPREFFKCPTSTAQFAALYHSQLDQRVVDAYRLLVDAGHLEERSLFQWNCFIEFPGLRIHVSVSGSLPFIRSMRQPDDTVKLSLLKAAQTIGDQPVADLVAWGRELKSYEEEAAAAIKAIEPVLEMANTVGQLVRMVPELVSALSEEKQASIAEQQKASALPPLWAPYPKEQVFHALNHITKCHLLPPVEFRKHEDNLLGFKNYGEVFPVSK